MTNAYTTLSIVADLVEAVLQPYDRAFAAAVEIREAASVGDQLPLTLADAHAGYDALSRMLTPAGQPAITERRQTCADIAETIRGDASTTAQPHRLGDVLAAVAARYAGAARQAAICETSKREALELAAVLDDEAAVLLAGCRANLERLGALEPATPQARNTMGGGLSMDEIIQGMHDTAAGSRS